MSYLIRALVGIATLAFATHAFAIELRIENLSGNVDVVIAADGEFGADHTSPDREPRPDDCRAKREEDAFVLSCDPTDGARVDLRVRAPFGSTINVKTDAGKISLEGFPTQFTGVTETGEIDLTCPGRRLGFALRGRRAQETRATEGLQVSQREVGCHSWPELDH
ncbi:MAG: hypothetical protein R2724_11010 [Bryobacterales bacterium]